MQRRVDDLELLACGLHQLRLDGERLDVGDVVVVDLLLADDLQQARLTRSRLVHLHRVLIAVFADQGEHLVGVLRRHLRAVLPVDLVAVVLRRVVAGGDDDARDGMQMAHRVGEHRHRAQLIEQVDVDALMRQHQRGRLGKLRAHAAGVVGDDHAAAGILGVLAVDVVGEALGGPAHVVQVHAVGARAEHAAHARGAEGQLGIEAVLDFLLIALKGAQLLHRRLVIREVAQPGLVLFTISHDT